MRHTQEREGRGHSKCKTLAVREAVREAVWAQHTSSSAGTFLGPPYKYILVSYDMIELMAATVIYGLETSNKRSHKQPNFIIRSNLIQTIIIKTSNRPILMKIHKLRNARSKNPPTAECLKREPTNYSVNILQMVSF